MTTWIPNGCGSLEKRQREDSSYLAQQMNGLEERVIDLETIYVSLPDVEKPPSLPEKIIDKR